MVLLRGHHYLPGEPPAALPKVADSQHVRAAAKAVVQRLHERRVVRRVACALMQQTR